MGADGILTSASLTPITTIVTTNVGLLVPIGITIMGMMIGISLIPRVIYKFL